MSDAANSIRRSARIAEQSSRSRQRREIQTVQQRSQSRRSLVAKRRTGTTLPDTPKAQQAAIFKAQKEAIQAVKKLEALTKQLSQSVSKKGGHKVGGRIKTGPKQSRGPRKARPVKKTTTKSAEELNKELTEHMSV
ncbi:hypothetical protein RCL1_000005 [Eukaryota sp. TZLM3-RCL]